MRPTRVLAAGAALSLALLPCFFAPEAGRAEEVKTPAPARPRTLRLPEVPYNYARPDLPAHFKTLTVRRFDNTPADNPVTDHGATLGRVLFYDTQLSANGTISCGSCHQQKHAFADPRRFSKGFNGKEGDRNAMSLVNVRFYPGGRFFWDERALSVEEQVLMPIQNSVEMGQDLKKLVEVIGKDPVYPGLFRKAFGDEAVSRDRVGQALAQFVRSLVSCRSKYDEGLAKVQSLREDFPTFTAQENRGKRAFLRNCGICHLPPGQGAVFSPARPLNNGLDAGLDVADAGRADVTFNRLDAGAFKSPSLRNVEFTAPYMHDGRFRTLEEVVEHYRTGVKRHPNLDPRLAGPRRVRLDREEAAAVVAFLKTLSDHKFITDPKFADPFQ